MQTMACGVSSTLYPSQYVFTNTLVSQYVFSSQINNWPIKSNSIYTTKNRTGRAAENKTCTMLLEDIEMYVVRQ